MFSRFTYDYILDMFDNLKELDFQKAYIGLKKLVDEIASLNYDELLSHVESSSVKTLYSAGTKLTHFYGHYTRSLIVAENFHLDIGRLVEKSAHKLYTYLYDAEDHLICIKSKRQNAVVFCNKTNDSEVFLVYDLNGEQPIPFEIKAVKYAGDDIAAIFTIMLYSIFAFGTDHDIAEYDVCREPNALESKMDHYSIHIKSDTQTLKIHLMPCINEKDVSHRIIGTYGTDTNEYGGYLSVDSID